MTAVVTTNLKIQSTEYSYAYANESEYKNIVVDIIRNKVLALEPERETETVESFTSLQKPGGRVRYIRETQK